MKLGFHYHSNFKKIGNQVKVPGYIGVFIDSIAAQVDELFLFLEEQPDVNSAEEDYILTQSNITLISLGSKSTFYSRLLNPKPRIDIIKTYAQKLDAFLLRAPSPLAPHIFSALSPNLPVYPLLVGNYVKGLKDLQQPFIRKVGIITLTYFYQWLHNKMISRAKIFVNSGELFKDNQTRAQAIHLIKTTTLNKDSFFTREDTCQSATIKLLFTGRINFQKGLRELIEAMSILSQFNLELHIVGWEEKGTFSYEEALKSLAQTKGLANQVFFHGKKQIGAELNAFYKTADIYVIPSYHEGFPRTIWEALANSLPVIATTVGSIPYYLENNKNAILIQPQKVDELAQAISLIINDKELRKKLINQGYTLTQEVTLEKQAQILINQLKKYTSEQNL